MREIFFSKTAAALATWVALLTAFFAVIAYLTPEWFGTLTWPQAIFVGVAAMLPASLMLAVSTFLFAVGFRKLRPLPSSPPELLTANVPHEPQVELIRDDALTRLEEKIGELEASMSKAIGRIEAGASLSTDYTRRQVASLYEALAAIGHRETMSELADGIEEAGTQLAQPTTGAVEFDQSQWEKWEAKEGKWRSILRNWCSLASCYEEGIAEKIFATPEARYKETGQAKIQQFPHAEAFFAYKTFWILYKNWREHREEGERAVYAAAFAGATSSERPVILGEGHSASLLNSPAG